MCSSDTPYQESRNEAMLTRADLMSVDCAVKHIASSKYEVKKENEAVNGAWLRTLQVLNSNLGIWPKFAGIYQQTVDYSTTPAQEKKMEMKKLPEEKLSISLSEENYIVPAIPVSKYKIKVKKINVRKGSFKIIGFDEY